VVFDSKNRQIRTSDAVFNIQTKAESHLLTYF